MLSGSHKAASRALGVVVGLACLGLAVPANAAGFDVSSLKGAYAGTISGASAASPEAYVPGWVVLRFFARGNGRLQRNVSATYNLGGCAIFNLSNGGGTYEVDGTGLGSATVTFPPRGFTPQLVESDACIGFPVPPIGPPITFTFEFAVSQATPGPDQVVDGITVSFVGTGADGDFAIATGGQGTIRRQGR